MAPCRDDSGSSGDDEESSSSSSSSSPNIARSETDGNSNISKHNRARAQEDAGLLKLPVELINEIARYLPWPPYQTGDSKSPGEYKDLLVHDDFLNFRLAHAWINDATFELFRKTYFTSRVVKLQFESLRDLVEIAEHPRLGAQMRTLRILPEPHDDNEMKEFGWVESSYMRKAKEANFSAEQWICMKDSFSKLRETVRTLAQNDQGMQTSGLAPVLLGRALAKFHGLRSIEYSGYGDFDYATNAKLKRLNWKTAKLWEAARVYEIDGTSLEDFAACKMYEDWELYRDGGLNTLLAAIIAGGATISTLKLESGSFLLGQSVRRHQAEVSLLRSCLQKLKSLVFSFRTTLPDPSLYENEQEAEEPGVDDALRFLSAIPDGLRELEINLNISPYEMNDISFDYKAEIATPVCNDLFSKIWFPQLETLKIKSTFQEIEGMARLIRNHRQCLRRVVIDHCVLKQGHPEHAMFRSLWGASDFVFKDARWSTILEACLECDFLETLQIHTQSDIYPAEHSSGIEVTDCASLELWFILTHLLGEEGVYQHGYLQYGCNEELRRSEDEPPAASRAEYLKMRLTQHLQEWKKAELAHGIM
ncbi:hypothetical protein IWZ01DRAFT_537400 [Phyllosticta capitalensis]